MITALNRVDLYNAHELCSLWDRDSTVTHACMYARAHIHAHTHTNSNPDIAPPSLSAHESRLIEMSYHEVFRFTSTNCCGKTVALYRGLTLFLCARAQFRWISVLKRSNKLHSLFRLMQARVHFCGLLQFSTFSAYVQLLFSPKLHLQTISYVHCVLAT